MPPCQETLPANHSSAIERAKCLRKNIRKDEDAWRCLVLDDDLLSVWSEVIVSPFGVVDNSRGDLKTLSRTVRDLSFPDETASNDFTDQDIIPTARLQPL